jgi:hypothetical protein
MDGRTSQRLLAQFKKSGETPLVYRHNGRAVASVVFLWLGWPATIASTIIMWKSLQHIDTHGPFSTHARTRDDVAKSVEKQPEGLTQADGSGLYPEAEGLPPTHAVPGVAADRAYGGV